MSEVSQNPMHGLNQPINQMFRGSGMNHLDQIQMNLLGSYNQSGQSGQQNALQQQQNYQNAFNPNAFSYSNQQVYPSAAAAAQLIGPNQISNVSFSPD